MHQESVLLMIFRRYADYFHRSFFSNDLQKDFQSFNATSPGMAALLHDIKIGISDESKKIWLHNQILTNEELRSNWDQTNHTLLNKNNQQVRIRMKRLRKSESVSYCSLMIPLPNILVNRKFLSDESENASHGIADL